MGIYDRDYYRREGPSFLGSFTARGTVCKWLIGINIVAFLAQIFTQPAGNVDGWFTRAFLLDPDAVLHGEVWRLLTYAFLHSTASPFHILWNMLFLWWFGSDVEDLYGPREFLAFYLVSATLGGVAHVLLSLVNWMPGVPVIGASGAVTTVLVLCAIHYPTRVIYLFMLFPVPIWLFVVFNVGSDFFAFMSAQRHQISTAVDVRLTGALFAFVYYKRHWHLSQLWPGLFRSGGLRAWQRRRSQPSLRVYHPEEPVEREPVGVPVGAASLDDEQLDAKVDAILEKISRTGKESLTEREREVLLRASELIKRRRS